MQFVIKESCMCCISPKKVHWHYQAIWNIIYLKLQQHNFGLSDRILIKDVKGDRYRVPEFLIQC